MPESFKPWLKTGQENKLEKEIIEKGEEDYTYFKNNPETEEDEKAEAIYRLSAKITSYIKPGVKPLKNVDQYYQANRALRKQR